MLERLASSLPSMRRFLQRRGGPLGRADWLVLAFLGVSTFARWPDRAEYLLSWDSHTFALALERYDVNGLRPHAPGYPVYVALGHVAHALVADANDAYILLSLACAFAGLAFTYLIGARLADRAIALGATLLVAAAPLLHVHAVTANAYAADLAFNAGVAWAALWCSERPSPRRVALLAGAFAVAVGVRQSLVFFLTPLVAWAALRPPWAVPLQLRRLVPGALTGLLVGLAWFLPMARASGGIAVWRRANDLQSEVVFEHPVWQDGWGMLVVNAERMALYLQWELTWFTPLLLALAGLALVVRIVRGGPRLDLRVPEAAQQNGLFLGLWGLPAALFYLNVYSGYGNGPSGYALILLPPLALAVALLARGLLRALRWPPVATAAVAVLLLATATAGLATHAHDVADGDYREHDAWVANWMGLPDAFPPSNTSIVTAYNFAHVWYYYPEYQVFEYRPPGKAVGEVPDFLMIQEANQHEAVPDWYDEIADRDTPGPHPLRAGVENLVLFDFQLAGENDGQRQLRPEVAYHEAWLPNGWRVLYVSVTPDRPDLEDYFTLEGSL